MPELEVKELFGNTPVSGSPNKAYKDMLTGIIFVFIGIISVIIVFHNRTPGERTEMPFPLVVHTCLIFTYLGIAVLIMTLKELFKKMKVEKNKQLYPEEPWKWDYEWDPAGIKERKTKSAKKAFLWVFFLFLFLLPFNWVALVPEQILIVKVQWLIMVGFFDIVIILILGDGIYLYFRQKKYGTGRLKFNSFPYFPGSELNVTFKADKIISSACQVKAVLRFVEERFEKDQERNTRTVSYQIYKDMLTLSAEDLNCNKKLSQFNLKFLLPKQNYETRMSEKPAKYWELEVEMDTPGIDYHAFFLIPVYSVRGIQGNI